MSTTATVAAPAGTIPQPTTTPLSNAASSWPIDSTAKKRRHRIDFYRRYCIPLDPTDETLSYTEQVTQYEDCISGGSRKVLPLGTYKERLANLVSSNSSLVNQITTKHDDGTTSTETVWTRQGNSYSDSCRVVHSCSIFDAMAENHYKSHSEGGRKKQTQYVAELTSALYISPEYATTFLAVCPLCHPISIGNVKVSGTPATSAVTVSNASAPSAVPSQVLTEIGATINGKDNSSITPNPKATPGPLVVAAAPAPAVVQNSIKSRSATNVHLNDLARKFVQQVHEMVDRMNQNDAAAAVALGSGQGNTLKPVLNGFDLYEHTVRLLEIQDEFRHAAKPTKVDIGYHYTRSEHMTSELNGLLNTKERISKQLRVPSNVANYEDGIYTASNPYAYHGRYGDVGIVIVRLLGRKIKCTSQPSPNMSGADSAIALRGSAAEIQVLSSPKLCIPMFQFEASQLTPSSIHPGNNALYKCHARLQAIVDRAFNAPSDELAASTRNTKARLSSDGESSALKVSAAKPKNNVSGPVAISKSGKPSVQYVAPSTFFDPTLLVDVITICTKTKCPLCQELQYGSPLYSIKSCQHTFHQHCLQNELNRSPNCPTCNEPIGLRYGLPLGTMPSGYLTMSRSQTMHCAGYNQVGTIIIDYCIPRGIQKFYHPNPGVPFAAIQRRTYIPATRDGIKLYKRLEYAFSLGQTFTVTMSPTTQHTSVEWASIPHKTSLTGGGHGFPDPFYIQNCNRELDKLGVPEATRCNYR